MVTSVYPGHQLFVIGPGSGRGGGAQESDKPLAVSEAGS